MTPVTTSRSQYRWMLRSAKDTTLEWFLFIPVAVVLGQLMVTGVSLFIWVLSLGLVRLTAVVVMGKVHRRLALSIIALVVSAIVPSLLASSATFIIILMMVGALGFWRTVAIVSAKEYLYPVLLYVLGLATYVAFAVMSSLVDAYRPMLPLITLFAFLGVAMVLFEVNHVTLGDASFTESENLDVDIKVKWTNNVHVLAIMAGVVIASICWFWLEKVLPRYDGQARPVQPGPHHQPLHKTAQKLPKMVPAQTGPFSHMLSILFQVIGISILCVIGGWAVFQAGKLLVHGISRLMTVLRGRVSQRPERGYVDTIESLGSALRKERMTLRRMRKAIRNERFEDIRDPVLKVRFIYRSVVTRAISQGFTWSKTDTSHETSERLSSFMNNADVQKEATDFAQLYEEARYSRHGVDESKVASAHKTLLKTRWTGIAKPRR